MLTPRKIGSSRYLDAKSLTGLGWLIGCIPAVAESIRILLSAYDRGIPEAILLSLGVYPLLGVIIGLFATLFPPLRKWQRAAFAFSLILLFPWIIGTIFPVISLRALIIGANLPKVIGVLFLSLLVARELGTHHSWILRIIPRSIPVMLLPLLFLGIAGLINLPKKETTPVRRSRPDDDRPNCILISVDTLREDELALWGGKQSVAPTLDSLASAGTVYRNCYSTAPWTLASISSFMTGEYPSAIQVLTGEHYLSENATTLAERLRDQGYYTHAIVSNIWLREQFGVAQGFDKYDHRRPPDERSAVHTLLPVRVYRRILPENHQLFIPESASDLRSRVTTFLRSNPPQPFFLWIHFNDVHDPYAPPMKYIPRGGARSSAYTYTSGRIVTLRMGRRLTPADRHRIRSLYRGEITYVDEQIRNILHVLRGEDLDTRTIVTATSDHGEEFWDHGSVGHGHTVYNELVGVPLIFSCPGKIPAGVVRDEPASLIDLVPTVVSLLDCRHSDRLPGIDLFENHLSSERPRFIEGLEFFREEKAVVSGTWKLAYTPDIQRSRLFELSTDSGEIADVSQSNEDRTSEMITVLERHQTECRRTADSLNLSASRNNMALTPRIREMLRAQGYLE